MSEEGRVVIVVDPSTYERLARVQYDPPRPEPPVAVSTSREGLVPTVGGGVGAR